MSKPLVTVITAIENVVNLATRTRLEQLKNVRKNDNGFSHFGGERKS